MAPAARAAPPEAKKILKSRLLSCILSMILRLLSPSALSFIPEVAAEAAEVKSEAEVEVAAS